MTVSKRLHYEKICNEQGSDHDPEFVERYAALLAFGHYVRIVEGGEA